MLQVDLETLVSACAGGSTDRKIACESQAEKTDPPEHHPDSPPESFCLSKDEETEWLDRNFVYERKESTKGNSNSGNLNLNSSSNSNTNSQRFANLKSKTSMIGLPKPQKPSFVDAKNRRNHKPSNIKLFPKRTASVGKSFAEPSSPKVSCMGRVRSKRGRTSSAAAAAAAVKERSPRTERKRSFFGSLRSIFRSGGRNKPDRRTDPPAFDSSVTNTNSVGISKARDSTASLNDTSFVESVSRNSVSESEPPSLGGMNRFKSGRRSDSWGGDDSEIHVSR
ncbi:unnamed protein product [Lathyrus sativus]|nr:unnamed protein product [Lathyrus sativus]